MGRTLLRPKILHTGALLLWCGAAFAGSGPLSPTVVTADSVVSTPAGVVTVSGRTVRLLSDAGPDAASLSELRLPAPARVASRSGFTVLLYPRDWSAPLFPDQRAPGDGDGCVGSDYGAVLVVGTKLTFRPVTTQRCEDRLTNDGRGLVEFVPTASSDSVGVEDLATGQLVTVPAKEDANSVFQYPQLVGNEDNQTLLWPSGGILELLTPTGKRLWTADDQRAIILQLVLSADRRQVLVARVGGALEVRRMADGSLIWSEPGDGALLEALHAQGLVTDAEYREKLGAPETLLSDVASVQPSADGWLVYASIPPDRGWIAHVSCADGTCTAQLVHPDLLRTNDVVMGLANGTAAYAFDMDLSVLHKGASGWSRVN